MTIQIGQPAPNVTFGSSHGNEVSLAGLWRSRQVMPLVAIAIGCALLFAVACSGGNGEAPLATAEPTADDAPYAGYVSTVYAEVASWLCRPDVAGDFCDENLDATIVNADGSIEMEPFELAADPPIDCFYVYPTISVDEEKNSDLVPDPEAEGLTVRNQAARFASQCRLYAPMYRQRTLTALIEGLDPDSPPADEATIAEIAYASLLDAWKHYIANDNDGRGVVLMGHSQGSSVLRRLMEEEIDGDEQLRGRLVSALLLGATVAVPEGEDVGGDFANIPLCREATQTGCVISYASFRDNAPPPAGSFFGRATEGMAACTNPASLAGGPGTLRPYFETEGGGGALSALVTVVEEPWASGVDITTPWVTLPGFVEAECVVKEGFSYLEIRVLADPADPRIDDIGGDILALPSFGLHIVDVNLGMGDLVEIVGQQAESYIAAGN